ncbi:hypothetical protein L249_0419 [Ophiocordyceps polyrhachis-furcata BCC 54312]|uniref:Stc1 domain-containing protein n=1 Tax=Ophiocordyceps polyrhachis-furcata BCC 54312 TaxID=1330021 RepID=A0A367LDI4_9HYPO|nr:hypothetical protein L249_0419 [Ophiocordyceps polyrhachis-furcata BCC 54312]
MARSRKTPLPSVDLSSSQPTAPTKFRCKVGGEWLPLASFSHAQQKLLQRRGNVNPANSGMTCRDHSATSRTDLRCDLCNLVKPISDFSRSNRQSDDHTCKRCSAWGETQEPHVTPSPLETGHVSIEESSHEVWQGQYVDSNDFYDNDLPQAPITELASLGLEDDEAIRAGLRSSSGGEAGSSGSEAISHFVSKMLPADDASECSRSSQASHVSSLPPHLRAKQKDKFPTSAGSVASTSESTGNYSSSTASAPSSLPPHLRGRAMQGGSGSGQAAGGGKIVYNAWGPDGNLRQGVKSVTVPSTSSAMSVSSSMGMTTDASSSSALNSPHNENNNRSKPHKKGGFAKAPRLSRTELRQHEPCMPIGVRHINPVREEARQMGCCQSDDSNY